MKRFISVMAGAAVALSGSLALAATPLPPSLGGGGFVPPDATANKVEQGVAKALTKLAAAVTKCHQKGVGNQIKAKPSGVSACDAAAIAKYNAGTAKLTGVPCIDPPTQQATGTNVAGLVPGFDPVLWCDGMTPLDGEMGGGFIPDAADNKTEQAVSKILIKHVGAVSKCALKGVGNLFKGKPDGAQACIDAARTKANASVAKIQAAINGLTPGDCLKGANAPDAPGASNDLLDLVTDLTLSFNGTIFCASPSGAFLN
jgi:hypothetical protein